MMLWTQGRRSPAPPLLLDACLGSPLMRSSITLEDDWTVAMLASSAFPEDQEGTEAEEKLKGTEEGLQETGRVT